MCSLLCYVLFIMLCVLYYVMCSLLCYVFFIMLCVLYYVMCSFVSLSIRIVM
jgi:hypothetical protein